MTPPEETTTIAPVSTLAVEVAKLTGKVEQVIGDHERRIAALERRRDGAGIRVAAIVAPYIAGAAVLFALASKISWNGS